MSKDNLTNQLATRRNVQVTLGILAALVEKSPKDAVLIAPVVLKILDLVLRSDDITMIESSLPTFEAFCEHHDQSSLFADQTYLQQYQDVVKAYAQLASNVQLVGKGADQRPIQNRRRAAGIQAIKSIAASDALASVSGRQIETIVPKILENLWTEDGEALEILLQRLEGEEKEQVIPAMRRRTSISTVRTADTVDGANPAVFSGTALDADRLAEEEIAVAAMQCLRSIFEVPNRPQVYAATNALIRFIFERVDDGEQVVERQPDSGWGPKILNIVARWAPVQDRYMILVTALDNLQRSPMLETNLAQQLALTIMIGSLLRSDINLIGLSVMDVLLGLIKQMRKLFALQIGSSPSGSIDEKATPEVDTELPKKKELLLQLEQSIADLATHVYYADQISDMISIILARLRPTRSSSSASTPPTDKIDGIEGGPNSSVPDLGDGQSQVDNYFSYNAGRVSALRVVKQVLLVANPKTKISGNLDLSRNRVPSHIWEGSHWLLRDLDGSVRKAYSEALVTWLDRETTALDARAQDELAVKPRASLRNRELALNTTARRALSSASNRERVGKTRKSQFLPMLHLSIYDNALQYVDNDHDIVLLHVLLTKLVFKLGVNATRYGVPMIYRLQEDVQELDSPLHKVRIAALCHGYFWALTEKFDFEASGIGRAIHNEVVRRRSKGFWIEGINIPAPSIGQIGIPGQPGQSPSWDVETLEREEILPFDERTTMVECIANAYEELGRSPPQSPVASPRREIHNPIHSSTGSSLPVGDGDMELPSRFRDQMSADFSRDAVLQALNSEGKTESLTGSRTGTTITTRHRLAVNTATHYSNGHLPSPFGSQRLMRPQSSSQIGGEPDKLGLFGSGPGRKTSVRSAISPATTGPKAGIASIEQLKMILAGNASGGAFPLIDDDSGDSMVSYETPSEASFNPPHRTDTTGSSADASSPPIKETVESTNPSQRGEEEDEVPPVPPIPKSHSFRKSDSFSDVSMQDYGSKGYPNKRNIHSRGGDSMRGSLRMKEESTRNMGLQDLLMAIDSRDSEGSLGNLSKPPY